VCYHRAVPPRWRVAGEYVENCNCSVLCPCIVGPRDGRGGALAAPTEGHCDVPAVFLIEEGAFGAVRLDGLGAALALHTPGPMGLGGWTVALYVDERAAPPQREALEAIFGGTAGGPIGRLAALVESRRPTRAVPIRLDRSDRGRRALIPGVLELEVEGLPGAERDREVWLDNVRHFAARRLAVARSLLGRYGDHGERWDHTGRNAHYARFDWTGP
jgi:hypothetical protein